MNAYTSNGNGTCARCGSPTTRSRLCKACGRDEHRESELRGGAEPDAQALECTNCGTAYEGHAGTRCPDCDSQRCRALLEAD